MTSGLAITSPRRGLTYFEIAETRSCSEEGLEVVRPGGSAHGACRAIECRQTGITLPRRSSQRLLEGVSQVGTPAHLAAARLGCLVTHTVAAGGEQEDGSATVACAK